MLCAWLGVCVCFVIYFNEWKLQTICNRNEIHATVFDFCTVYENVCVLCRFWTVMPEKWHEVVRHTISKWHANCTTVCWFCIWAFGITYTHIAQYSVMHTSNSICWGYVITFALVLLFKMNFNAIVEYVVWRKFKDYHAGFSMSPWYCY